MSDENYYLIEDEQKIGPFSLDDLKLKGIEEDTLIWTKGLDKWTMAKYIPMLKEIIDSTPPPIPKNINRGSVPSDNSSESEKLGVNEKYFGYELARKRDRFFATLLEGIVLYIPIVIIYALFDKSYWTAEYDYFSIESLKDTLFWSVPALIFGAIFYPLWSGNLGHKMMRLKVISTTDGKDKENPVDGALREFLKSFLGILIIPIIWILWDDDNQNLYDKISKTIVVKKK